MAIKKGQATTMTEKKKFTVPANAKELEMDFDYQKELISPLEGMEMIDPNDIIKGPTHCSDELDDKWYENYQINKKYITPFKPKNYKDKLFILVGASPAIKRNVHFLRDLDDRFEIIASNSSAKFLVENNVKFNYFMVIEAGNHISSDFDFDSSDVTLIASPFACPDAYTKWRGEKYTYFLGGGKKYQEAFENDWAGKVDIDIGGGNVVSSAYLWAYKYLNARHVAVTGMSLCYYDTEKYYFDGREKPNDPLEKWEKWLKAIDMYGNKVTITPQLILYKVWLETYIQYAIKYGGGSFINATEDGVLGVLPQPIEKDGSKVRFERKFIPWINITPLYMAIDAHKLRMEDNQDGTSK